MPKTSLRYIQIYFFFFVTDIKYMFCIDKVKINSRKKNGNKNVLNMIQTLLLGLF